MSELAVKSKSNLCKAFKEAKKNSTAIIFIIEIDSMVLQRL